jgi:2-iminoacetate synthase
MSAGSKTNPGGYGNDDSLEQFEISDERSVTEVTQYLQNAGYDIVWKDWDESYDKPNEVQSHPELINAMNGNQKFTFAS